MEIRKICIFTPNGRKENGINWTKADENPAGNTLSSKLVSVILCIWLGAGFSKLG